MGDMAPPSDARHRRSRHPHRTGPGLRSRPVRHQPWLNEGRTPQVNQLRKIATPLRATMLDLLIAAGYVSPDELGVTDTPSSAVVADVAEAIKRDADLIDEARLHLLNQYALLRRLGPDEPSETPARKTSRRPASPDAPVARPIRAAARRGKPDRT